ncbi:MAG: hypothetical protein H3Z50_06925, partial [archaeon]|nr:hypothetical protein [archaeon]
PPPSIPPPDEEPPPSIPPPDEEPPPSIPPPDEEPVVTEPAVEQSYPGLYPELEQVQAVWWEVQDGVLMVKFERAMVISLIDTIDCDAGEKFYELTLTVTVTLLDETTFEGTDTIKVIQK